MRPRVHFECLQALLCHFADGPCLDSIQHCWPDITFDESKSCWYRVFSIRHNSLFLLHTILAIFILLWILFTLSIFDNQLSEIQKLLTSSTSEPSNWIFNIGFVAFSNKNYALFKFLSSYQNYLLFYLSFGPVFVVILVFCCVVFVPKITDSLWPYTFKYLLSFLDRFALL